MSTSPRVPARRRRADERGAVAVMVAILMVLVMGLAALSLDSGNGWETRRSLVTATDAAALAAAEVYAQNGDGCAGVPATFVRANVSAASVTDCSLTALGPGAAAVTVQAATPLHYTFAGIIGVGDRDVHSSTTAAYGQPLGVTGLRPLGLCNASVGYQQWLDSGMSTPFTVTINYGKDAPTDCGANVPGNWGVQDFDGGANSNADTRSWIEDGYPGMVTAPSSIPGDTGAFSNSLSSALSALVASGAPFQIPIFDSAAGSGSTAQFHVIGFVSVVLVDFNASGSATSRWLRVEFVSHVAQGTCCSHGTDTGTRVVFICAVDADFPMSNCRDR
jgi:Flp pilus assembly protein TadG